MESMTGFGRAAGENGRHRVTVRLRSVNGRYLDLNLRLRDEYRASEPALRDLFVASLARGRVEAAIEVQALAEPEMEVAVRRSLVRSLATAAGELAAEGLLEGGLRASDLLRVPEALVVRSPEEDWRAEDQELLLAVAAEALAQLVAARRAEGAKLAAVIAERLAGLASAAERLDTLRETAAEEAATALERRLVAVLGDRRLDEQRLAQEVAVLADRSDVGEEIDRLGAHLEHFRSLAAEAGPVGKRLDFVAQEIGRELNTLGAKCRHNEVSRVLVEARGLCEQLREQLQNVE